MHRKFLPMLCCPKSGGPLALKALETSSNGMVRRGTLTSRSGSTYPIVRGVPRFVGDEHYATSFGWEWSRWPRVQFESENVGGPMAGHTTRMWERITGVTDEQIHQRTIVDFGCGPGRFLDVVRRKGGRAVGIDLSRAVDAARENFPDDPDVLIVQGDLLQPPFRPDVFDGAFSIGVLHHTPAPARGLRRMTECVRPGGWTACCVYPEGDFYDFPSVRRFRAIHARLNRWFGYGPALLYAYAAAYGIAPTLRKLKRLGLSRQMSWVEENVIVSLYLKDAQWRLLDTFDAITPSIASTHRFEEVRSWFEGAGGESIRQTDWCPTSVTATRARSGAALAA